MERGHQRGRGALTGFFADTYAILAYLQGDPAYVRRFAGASFRTGLLNLYEAHFAQVSMGLPAEEAAENVAPFEASVAPLEWAVLREASTLRLDLRSRGRRCSYIDAAGYAQARSLKLPFLTGDAAFEGLDGVEFLREQPKRGAGPRRPR